MRHSPTPEPAKPVIAAATPVVQRLLVVEDLEDTRVSMQQLLQLSLGLEVDTADDGAEAMDLLRRKPYSVVVADLRMPRLSGMGMLEKINEERLPVTVIVTTGHGGVPEAVEAIRLGAYDFLT